MKTSSFASRFCDVIWGDTKDSKFGAVGGMQVAHLFQKIGTFPQYLDSIIILKLIAKMSLELKNSISFQ